MKYFKIIQAAICAGALITGTIDEAAAGSFSDTLKDFVLGPEAQANTQSPQFPVNSLSHQCIACHDGSRAQPINLKSADTPLRFTGHTNSDHPVGMSYSEYARRAPGSYINPARLDHRIQLENDAVTCVSCHEIDPGRVAAASLETPAEAACTTTGALTVGPQQTGLCVSCHVM